MKKYTYFNIFLCRSNYFLYLCPENVCIVFLTNKTHNTLTPRKIHSMKALTLIANVSKSFVSALVNGGGYFCNPLLDNSLDRIFCVLQSLFSKGSAYSVANN